MAKKKEPSKSRRPRRRPTTRGIKIVARNRRARHDYELMEKVEAGIVLTGTEVKSLRNGKASLEEAYAGVDRGEVWLYGCDIPEYLQANRMNHKPKRPRKLLLHRREIDKLDDQGEREGADARPAVDLLQERDRQGRDQRRQGPQDVRQARGAQEAGRQARHRPGHAARGEDRLPGLLDRA